MMDNTHGGGGRASDRVVVRTDVKSLPSRTSTDGSLSVANRGIPLNRIAWRYRSLRIREPVALVNRTSAWMGRGKGASTAI
jgi:hypothetical protein